MLFIGFDHLEPNKMYYIEQHTLDGIKKSIGTFIKREITLYYEVACFKNIVEFNTERKNSYNYNFHRGCNFYEVRKIKAQQAMEHRALTQILRKILPDEYFLSVFYK